MLRDQLSPIVEKNLTPKAIVTINTGITKYIDKNSAILMTLNLSDRYSFNDIDRNLIYENCGLNRDMVLTEVKNFKGVAKNDVVKSEPFYCTCMLVVRELLKQKKENEARKVMTYMSMMMYVILHGVFFKYKNNPKIMNYTLAHLDNSFLIRQMSSLLQWIDNNATTTLETYKSRIIKGDDDDIVWVIKADWDRLKGKMRKISNAYYDNWKSGNYLNEDDDSYSDSDFHEMDNNSYAISRLVTKTYIKLLNHQYDKTFLKYSITRSDTSLQKLTNLVNDIIDSDEGTLKKFLSSMVEYFLMFSGKSFEYIGRGEFISYMKSSYASNADNVQMVNIKSILDKWLDENIVSVGRQNYGKTARLGYKKSLYMFFTFILNKEAKFQ